MTEVMPYEHCPHFDDCSVNKCPLDTLYLDRKNVAGDDHKCQLSKARRLKIFNELDDNFREKISHGGMTTREAGSRNNGEHFKKINEVRTIEEKRALMAKAIEAKKRKRGVI